MNIKGTVQRIKEMAKCEFAVGFRNVDRTVRGWNAFAMHNIADQHRDSVRAPRVNVPNKERALVALGNQHIAGILCKLSATGGTVRLPRSLAKGTVADLTLKAVSGRISSAVEFLGPADRGTPPAQAFRFIHMPPAESRRLENALEEIRKQGFGEKQDWRFHPIARTALRTMRSITRKRQ